MVHGTDLWGIARSNSEFCQAFNDAMACDGQFVMDILLKDHGEIFQGIGTLVDVGGGSGGTVRAISNAFPDMKCAVLDLPHVIGDLKSQGNVEFVAGDMFDDIPPADAVLLKVCFLICFLISLKLSLLNFDSLSLLFILSSRPPSSMEGKLSAILIIDMFNPGH